MSAAYPQLNLDVLPPYLSQMVVNPNATQDIMTMGMDELDSLKQQNLDRIKEIEEKYFKQRDELKSLKEIC